MSDVFCENGAFIQLLPAADAGCAPGKLRQVPQNGGLAENVIKMEFQLEAPLAQIGGFATRRRYQERNLEAVILSKTLC